MPRQFSDGIGVVKRKLNKDDYSLPSSYRVINLLDVWGKAVERVVVHKLEEWEEEGLGEEHRVGENIVVVWSGWED